MYTLCHYGLVVPGFSVVYVFNELHFAKDKMRDNFLNGFGQDFLQKIYTEREREKKAHDRTKRCFIFAVVCSSVALRVLLLLPLFLLNDKWYGHSVRNARDLVNKSRVCSLLLSTPH